MSIRRRAHSFTETSNKDRWLISYADFITVLFALFVVLYAISSVDEGRYEELSSTFIEIFNTAPQSNQPIDLEMPPPAGPDGNLQTEAAEYSAVLDEPNASEQYHKDGSVLPKLKADIARVSNDLPLISISGNDAYIEIVLSGELVFSPGSSSLSEEAEISLFAVIPLIKSIEYPIVVEGHSDSAPQNDAELIDNWALSAARAATVVRYLSQAGIGNQQMSIQAFADTLPLDPLNNTIDAFDRRVVITISRSDWLKF